MIPFLRRIFGSNPSGVVNLASGALKFEMPKAIVIKVFDEIGQNNAQNASLANRLIQPQNIEEENSFFSLDTFHRDEMLIKAIDGAFWQKFGCEIDEPLPIPNHYIEHPRRDCTLVYIPDSIIMNVPVNSFFVLDESVESDEGHRARLRIDVENAPKVARQMRVPITPNNLIALAQHIVMEQSPQLMNHTCMIRKDILNRQGDMGVQSHWSYQKKGLIGLGLSYEEQLKMAEERGFTIVPLIDRLFFDFASSMKFGQFPQGNRGGEQVARTSTYVSSSFRGEAPATIDWCGYGEGLCLEISNYDDDEAVGAAVGVLP